MNRIRRCFYCGFTRRIPDEELNQDRSTCLGCGRTQRVTRVNPKAFKGLKGPWYVVNETRGAYVSKYVTKEAAEREVDRLALAEFGLSEEAQGLLVGGLSTWAYTLIPPPPQPQKDMPFRIIDDRYWQARLTIIEIGLN